MKIREAIKLAEQHSTSVPPPTQLAPYQQLAYMYKHWGGSRPEYEPKDDYINEPNEKKKKKKKKRKKKDDGHDVTVEQYNMQNTRDVAPNYLVRSLSPFFYMDGIEDEEDFEQKKDYIYNKKSGKKKKVKKDEPET